MRDMKRRRFVCFIIFYSWEWLRFTVAWLKRKINLKYRAFSTRYITDTVCRERMTRIVSSLSPMTNVCTRERQRARETMKLGLQCLANRLFESYRFQRIASLSIARSERYNGRQKRAGTARNNGNTKTDYVCTYIGEKDIFLSRSEVYTRTILRFLYAYRMCILCVHYENIDE